ncbi:MAG: hypothetical protein ACYDA1_05640 [Vulcanimicrobiaceae bacterium]
MQGIAHSSLSVERSAYASYEAAKHYLCKAPVERDLFTRLEHAPKRSYSVKIIHDGNDRFDPNSDTIYWDPTSALKTSDGGHQSPALGLGHEVDHAVERRCTLSRLSHLRCHAFDNDEERRVIRGSETQAARYLGESVRTDHGGTLYRVSSPILR